MNKINYIIFISLIFLLFAILALYKFVSKQIASLTDNITLVSKTDVSQFLQLRNMLSTQLDAIKNYKTIGSIFSFAGNNIPDGFALCDGSKLLISDYQDLFNIIGNTYNQKDTDSTLYFNLPDLRGIFIRGLSSDRKLGSFQLDATALPKIPFVTDSQGTHSHTLSKAGAHSHTTSHFTHMFWTGDIRAYIPYKYDDGPTTFNTDSAGDHTHTIDPSGSHTHVISGGDPETHPPNLALNYIICVK